MTYDPRNNNEALSQVGETEEDKAAKEKRVKAVSKWYQNTAESTQQGSNSDFPKQGRPRV
jgi:hypothetical protein